MPTAKLTQQHLEHFFGKRYSPLIANAGAMPLDNARHWKRWVAVPAGRRSGKTERFKRHVLLTGLRRLIGDYPFDDQHYFLAAPVHDQAKGIYWADMKRFLHTFESAGLVNRSETKREITISHPTNSERTCTWHVLGLDKAERIEGPVWDGGGIDEYGNCKPDTFEAHIRPALDTLDRAQHTFCWIFGVPEGRNHYYDLAMRWKAEYERDPDGPYGYYTWFSSEVLSKGQVDEARRMMDPKTFAQEYEASWETKSGLVYYAYAADNYPAGNHGAMAYNEALPIYAGFDFNVDPMTAVLGHIVTAQDGPNAGKKELHVFRGYFVRNCNTRSLIERICADYPKAATWYVTPCQSSMARQTVADLGVTDRRIMEATFRDHGRSCFFYAHGQNPLIRDRVNATNSLLNARRLRLNASDAGVMELCKDLQGIAYKEGTSDHDLKDPMRGHISAACAYLVEYHFPIRAYDKPVEAGFIV